MMGKTILGCSKNDFLLDPRTPEGEIYYAENPNLLYLIRQSYGGKYPNNGEGEGDTPWTTMPNCVAYMWARCMEIWVPLIEQCTNYHDADYQRAFNNGQPFYDGLDYLRKVYDIDRLALGNGEDTIVRLYQSTDIDRSHFSLQFKWFHLDYIIPWETAHDYYNRNGYNFALYYLKTGGQAPYYEFPDYSAASLEAYAVDDYKNLQPKITRHSELFVDADTETARDIQLYHPPVLQQLMWNSSPIFMLPTGSIMVYGSGNLGQGRAGHVMVVEDGSSVTETEFGMQLFPTISDANIPHNSWGRTVKYYDWTKYAGSVDRDKYNHVYRDEAEDFLVGIILPPMEIIQHLLSTASKHRTRFGKINFSTAKTLRRIHAGHQDYTPE